MSRPIAPLAALLTLTGAAHAAPAAFYHPDTVAEQSARFAESVPAAAAAFDRAQLEVGRLGEALEDLEQGVALCGDALPAESRAWAELTRKQGLGQFLVVQRFVDGIQDDYSGAFEAALKRALPAVGGEGGVAVCKPSGPRLGPGGGGSRACEGRDLNPALAKAIDADPELRASLAEITGRAWPGIAVEPAPQPVVALTGAERWISASALVDAFLIERVRARAELLEDQQASLEEEEPTPERIAEAQAQKDAYLSGIARDGAALREAAAAALARAEKKGQAPAAVGVCANPSLLGACAGEDVTGAALELLRADKKLQKALEAAFRSDPIGP